MLISKLMLKAFWNHTARCDNKRIAKQTAPEGADIYEDIPYINGSENPMHLLDIYKQKGASDMLPVVFNIHGGGWLYGTKRLNKHFGMFIASEGFLVFNINYRLVPEVSLKEQVKDIFSALEWANQNITKYGGDKDNFFVVGDSAGGHLAVLASMINNCEGYQERFNQKPSELKIKALGLICPATDLEIVYKYRLFAPAGGMLKMILGKGYRKSDIRKDISFKYCANKELLPPIYVASSEQDFLKFQTKSFVKILDNLGAEYKLRFWDKAKKPLTHVFPVINHDYKESEETNREMLNFFLNRG
ncbi:MAG: alpha/beta hydrolase [Firmicutes bacterium]|nr:alpha/beta hydrolase [Bacillota bacterium]